MLLGGRSGQRLRHFPHTVSFSSPNRSDLLYSTTEISQLFSRDRVSARDAPGLCDGLIWPKTRLRLDRLSRNAVAYDFLPLGFAHSSRGKKVAATTSSASLRP